MPCRNAADLSRNLQPLTTATNPAYELMKQGEGKNSDQVNVSAGTDLPITEAEYEVPDLPPSQQALPAIPTVEDVGVAKEVKAEMYMTVSQVISKIT